jgi:hypothetical protein
MHDEASLIIADPGSLCIALVSRMSSNPGSVKVLSVDPNEFFGSGNDEDVRLFCIAVSRQALVGPSRDRRQRKLPPEPEGSVSGTTVES